MIEAKVDARKNESLPCNEGVPFVEVAGIPVTCIASSIRSWRQVDWSDYYLTTGVGQEGNLVLGHVKSVGAGGEMEYLGEGDDICDLFLQENDAIVGVLANRHSGTSEYGEIPHDGIKIQDGTYVDLIAGGGVMGNCLDLPKIFGEAPTIVACAGLLAKKDEGIVQLRDFYPRWEDELNPCAPIVLSCGTAAEIGKTTTARAVIKELLEQGVEKVAASKLAGTGRKKDIATLAQAGACCALDFPEVGLATTYTAAEIYTPAIYTLLNRLNREGNPEVILGECGGDIIEGNVPHSFTRY